MLERKDNGNPLQREKWASLFDARQSTRGGHPAKGQRASSKTKAGSPTSECEKSTAAASRITAHQHILALDTVTYMVDLFRDRVQRLNLSVRQLERAKRGLFDKELIKEVWLGRVLLLAPTEKLYLTLGMESPYRRNAWDIHSFLILVAAKLIELNPLVKYVKPEVFLGDSYSTLDLGVYLKDGNRWAYEIIHKSITNVAANAAKLQGKGFSQAVFLCTDFNIKQRVWASIRNAGFAPNFLSTVRVQIFSALMRQNNERKLR